MSTGPIDPLSVLPHLPKAIEKAAKEEIKKAGLFELLKEHLYAQHPSPRYASALMQSITTKYGIPPQTLSTIVTEELIRRTRLLSKIFPEKLPVFPGQVALPGFSVPKPKIPSPEAATRAIGRPAMMGIGGLLGAAIGGTGGDLPGAILGGLMGAMAGAEMFIPGAEVPKPPAGATTWQKFKWAMHPANVFASPLRTLGLLNIGLMGFLPKLIWNKIAEEAARRQQQVSTLEGGGGAATRSDNTLSSLIQRITSQARVHPGNRW
jgi:hypothetical protein